MILSTSFYKRDTLSVAEDLLGKILVHNRNGYKTSGKIIEVEAYLGLRDKAAHSYSGKTTERVKTMYGPPGNAYVFLIYGMYHCMNVVTREEGVPEAVLIRAIEPIDGLDTMAQRRFKKPYSALTKRQTLNLTNGPGKLCIAMSITKKNNGQNLQSTNLYLKDSESKDFEVVKTKRVGIDYAEEAKDFPWRFYIKGHINVSKK